MSSPSQLALCQLPNEQWLTTCQITAEFEEKDANGINQKKAAVILTKTKFSDSVHLIIPHNTLIKFIPPDYSESDQEASITFKFRYTSYQALQLKHLQAGDTVLWLPQKGNYGNESIYVVKIHLVGVEQSYQNGPPLAFIVAPSAVNPFYDFDFMANCKDKVYRVPLQELIFLRDYASLMETVKNLNFVGTQTRTETSGVAYLELFYSSCTQNVAEKESRSLPEPIQPVDPVKGPLSPLTKSTMPQKKLEKAESGFASDKSLGNSWQPVSKERGRATPKVEEAEGACALAESIGNGNGWQYVSKGRGRSTPKGIAKRVETNISDDDKRGLQHNQLWESTEKGTEPEIKNVNVYGNCRVKALGFQSVKVDGINKGDTVMVNLDKMLSGTVGMICTVGDDVKTTWIGLRFEESVTAPFLNIIHEPYTCLRQNIAQECRNSKVFWIRSDWLLNKQDSPLFILIPKVTSPSQETPSQMDFSLESRRNGEFVCQLISHDFGLTGFKIEGIHGYRNSCYADSALFAMFAFTNAFDSFLDFAMVDDPALAQLNLNICDILKYDIVSQLRAKGGVDSTRVYKLRTAMSKYNQNFMHDFMDTEEFILTLFEKVMLIPGFYGISGDDSPSFEYIFQTFISPGGDIKPKALMQTILEKSFKESGVKLGVVPSPAFIIKLPVSDGKKMFEMVKPNLEIDLTPFTNLKGFHESPKMVLRAVICLNKSHYTCFVRAGPGKMSDWVFVDSRPGQGEPIVRRLTSLSSMLQERESKMTRDPGTLELFDYLVSNAYMCFYEPA